MPTFLQDLRLSLRSLLRQPLFTGMAAALLALGIGASTVIFSVVYALLLRPLPYPDPGALVHIGMRDPAFPNEGAFAGLAPEVLDHLKHDPDTGLSCVTAFGYDYANLTGVPTPAQLTVGLVTTDYFRVFGVPAARGRWFDDADGRAGAPATVMVSDHLWRTQFHADEGLVGKTIILDDKPRTVVGIMGATFKDINTGGEAWLPLKEGSAELAPGTSRRYITTGRLARADTESRQTLAVYLATLSGRLAQSSPARYQDWRLEAHPLAGNILIGPAAVHALWLLLGAVGCVGLVTCANVANLQLVRAAARRRETGVRLALGASRARIMRDALTESLLLAAAGAGLGVLLAAWGVDAVSALLPEGYSPLQDSIGLNRTVLGFSTGVAGLAGVLTGIFPAWSAGRQDPAGALTVSAGRGATEGAAGSRVRAGLVVAEIALALVLLAGAGLMGRSLLAALRTDPGVRLDGTLVVNLSLSPTRYPDRVARREFYRRTLASVEAVPGVAGTALTDTALFSWYDAFRFLLPGQNADDPAVRRQTATDDAINPGGFAALGIPLRRGRIFDEGDTATSPRVVIVNEEFVRRFLPEGEPLGRRITTVDQTSAEFEVVGVVGSVRRTGLGEDAPAAAYFPYLQRPSAYAALYVRTADGIDAASLTHAVEAAIWRVDADQAIGSVSTLERAASASMSYPKLYAGLFGSFAALTLVLAALGIYGTVAYSVGLRTREIGIRMALGAQQADVLRLVLGQGARLAAAGLALGIGTTLALSHLMTALLYGIKPTDPLTLVAVALLLVGVSMLASWLPARKAARIDQLRALREE